MVEHLEQGGKRGATAATEPNAPANCASILAHVADRESGDEPSEQREQFAN